MKAGKPRSGLPKHPLLHSFPSDDTKKFQRKSKSGCIPVRDHGVALGPCLRFATAGIGCLRERDLKQAVAAHRGPFLEPHVETGCGFGGRSGGLAAGTAYMRRRCKAARVKPSNRPRGVCTAGKMLIMSVSKTRSKVEIH